jgi:hypothetical protein
MDLVGRLAATLGTAVQPHIIPSQSRAPPLGHPAATMGTAVQPHAIPSQSPSPHASSVSTTSMMGQDRLVERMAAEKARFFSSHQPSANDAYAATQMMTMAQRLPEYRWRKAGAEKSMLPTTELTTQRRALQAVADLMAESVEEGWSLTTLCRQLTGRMTPLGRALTPSQAAEVDVLLRIAVPTPATAGAIDWPRVVLCELAPLTRSELEPRMVEVLRTARTAHPGVTSGVLDCAGVGGLPVRATTAPRQPASTDRPRVCKSCGSSHVGPWATHACSAGKKPSGATAPPSVRKSPQKPSGF